MTDQEFQRVVEGAVAAGMWASSARRELNKRQSPQAVHEYEVATRAEQKAALALLTAVRNAIGNGQRVVLDPRQPDTSDR